MKNSSAKSSASCNIWFRGRTSRQSNIAFRRNFIMLAFDEGLVWLKRVSNMKWFESCRLFTSWKIILRSSKIACGTVSKLRILSIHVDLLVFVLDKKNGLVNKKKDSLLKTWKQELICRLKFKTLDCLQLVWRWIQSIQTDSWQLKANSILYLSGLLSESTSFAITQAMYFI